FEESAPPAVGLVDALDRIAVVPSPVETIGGDLADLRPAGREIAPVGGVVGRSGEAGGGAGHRHRPGKPVVRARMPGTPRPGGTALVAEVSGTHTRPSRQTSRWLRGHHSRWGASRTDTLLIIHSRCGFQRGSGSWIVQRFSQS